MDLSTLDPQLISAALYCDLDMPPMLAHGRRSAAVLMPLFQVKGEWRVLYIKRTSRYGTHQGQIAFPGGTYEHQDANLLATMYREVEEEVGIVPARINVLGRLDCQFTTSSRYNIVPCVGVIDCADNLCLQRSEVDKVLSMPLAWLANPANVVEEWMQDELGQQVLTFRYHPWQGEILWGATARMTQNFISLIHRIQ